MISEQTLRIVKISALLAFVGSPLIVLADQTTVSPSDTPTTVVQTDTNQIPDEVNQQNVTNFAPQTAQPGGQIINSVTQNNIVAVGQSPSPTPKPTREPVAASNDRISFFVTDERSSVRPGETLPYRFVIRNDSDQDISEITLRARIPEFVVPFDATPQSQSSNPDERTITWRDQHISARSETTFTISGTLEAGVPNDFTLHASAILNGPGVRASAVDATTVTVIGPAIDQEAATTVAPTPQVQGVQSVPQTVPVTARTGSGFLVTSLLSITAGIVGLRKSILA